jgi:hypothetical protein
MHGVDGGSDGIGGFAAGKASGPEGEILKGTPFANMKVADEYKHE